MPDPRWQKYTVKRPSTSSPAEKKTIESSNVSEKPEPNDPNPTQHSPSASTTNPSKGELGPPIELHPIIKPRPRAAVANMGATSAAKPTESSEPVSKFILPAQPSTPKRSMSLGEPHTPQAVSWPSTPRSSITQASPSRLEAGYLKQKQEPPESADGQRLRAAFETIGAYELLMIQMAEKASEQSLDGMLDILEAARSMPKIDHIAEQLNIKKSAVDLVIRRLTRTPAHALPRYVESSLERFHDQRYGEGTKKHQDEIAEESDGEEGIFLKD